MSIQTSEGSCAQGHEPFPGDQLLPKEERKGKGALASRPFNGLVPFISLKEKNRSKNVHLDLESAYVDLFYFLCTSLHI